MAAPKRCPGCSHPIARTEDWCNPCHHRLPAGLRDAVTAADRALRAAAAEALVWLDEHPHATDRELQVIELAAQGAENERIAAELCLSIHTVRDHWKRLMTRWGCSNRTQVVAAAFRLGYLQIRNGPERKSAA